MSQYTVLGFLGICSICGMQVPPGHWHSHPTNDEMTKLLVERDRYARALRRQARHWMATSDYKRLWDHARYLAARELRGPWRESWVGLKR